MTERGARAAAAAIAIAIVVAIVLLLLALPLGDAPTAAKEGPPAAAPPAPSPAAPAATAAPVAPRAAPPAEAPSPAATGSIVGVALRLDGAPAAGARIRAAPGGDEAKRVVATAGADGAFRFEALAPGRWAVACGGGGYGTRLDQGARDEVVEVVAGAEARVEIRAQQLAAVSGRVVGPGGKPIAGATVRVQCDAFLSPTGGGWRLETKTDAEGKYECGNVTPEGYASMTVTAEGFAPEDRDLPDPEPGSRAIADFSLAPAVAIEILLLSADDGSPVREAIVWVTDAESGSLYEGPHGDAWRPDQDGRVRVPAVRDTRFEIQVEAKGFARAREVFAKPSAEPGRATMKLERAFSISGRVLKADGSPAAGQSVFAVPAGETDPAQIFMHDFDAETGEDGGFVLSGMKSGRYRVGVGENPFEAVVETEVETGATGVVLRLPPGSATTTVNIRFQAPDGTPVPKAMFRSGVMVEGALLSSAGGGMHQPGARIKLEEGRTAFVEAWDARDAADARLPLGHVFLVVPPDAPADWVVTLPAERTISGRVVGPDGAAVEGARIEVATIPADGVSMDLSQDLVGTSSAAGGRFRVDGLGAGRVRLRAFAKGFFGVPVEAAAGAGDVVVVLAREVPCELRVLDPAGRPVEGALVSVIPRTADGEEEPRWGRADRTPSTDREGRARIRGIEPGRLYLLLVDVPSSRRDLDQLRVEEWTPVSGDLRLPARE